MTSSGHRLRTSICQPARLSGHGYSRTRPALALTLLPRRPHAGEQQRQHEIVPVHQQPLRAHLLRRVGARTPRLKLVLVENEIGWTPFLLEQWDYYFERDGTNREGLAIKKLPSEYFHGQVYSTSFKIDAVGGHMLSWWGADNCMWSNDFPTATRPGPDSRQIVARDWAILPAGLRAKLVRENVARLYDMPVPSPALRAGRSPSTLVGLIKGHLEVDMAKMHHFAPNLIFSLLAFCACARSNDVEDSKVTQKTEKVAETVRQKAQVSEKAEGSQDLVKDKVSVKKTAKGESVIEQTGEASSYGQGFQGKTTANGEKFDKNDLTAAHPTLPLGTKAKVTNLKNGRSVNVRINDRGPTLKDAN